MCALKEGLFFNDDFQTWSRRENDAYHLLGPYNFFCLSVELLETIQICTKPFWRNQYVHGVFLELRLVTDVTQTIPESSVWPARILCSAVCTFRLLGWLNESMLNDWPCLITFVFVRTADFEILAFPCNQFGGQEPGTNEQIKEFACTRFKAEYPIFDKVTHPLLWSVTLIIRGITVWLSLVDWKSIDLWSLITNKENMIPMYNSGIAKNQLKGSFLGITKVSLYILQSQPLGPAILVWW